MAHVGPPKAQRDLLYLAFNQDHTCIAAGTRHGFSISNCDPFGRIYQRNDGAVSIVEMLFCTSLVALVGAGDRPNASTRKLSIINTKRQSTICELTFPTTILAVKLNRKRLAVVLQDQIFIYDIANMKSLHVLETASNSYGIAALSTTSSPSFLAFPSPASSVPTGGSPPLAGAAPPAGGASGTQPQAAGTVAIFDTLGLSHVGLIAAHRAPLACVALSSSSSSSTGLLATASTKGTVIRVWSVPSGDKLYEFRRGSRPARIWSLSFNAVGSLLAVSSDTETVHIFKLAPGDGAKSSASRNANDSSISTDSGNGGEQYGRRRMSSIGSKLLGAATPIASAAGGAMRAYLEQPQRDFAHLRLPAHGIRAAVAIASTSPTVMVLASDGAFYSYALDLEKGGECVLQRSYAVVDSSSAQSPPTNGDDEGQ